MDPSVRATDEAEAVCPKYEKDQPSLNPTKRRHQLPSRIAVPSDREVQPTPFTPPGPIQKAVPNSGKRRAAPNLNRSSPATSHHNRISAIFEDAGRAIHPASAPRPLTTAARRLRMPLAETANLGSTQPCSKQHTNDIESPNPTTWDSSVVRRHFTAFQHTPTCDDDLRSTLPGNQDWQNEVDDQSPLLSTRMDENAPNQRLEDPSPSPLKLLLPPRERPTITTQSPSAEKSCQVPTAFSHRLTPREGFTDTPRRKKARISPSKGTPPVGQDGSFEIYEDETCEEVVELSPSVQQYRRGRGPKRERCMSYWDNDIVPNAIAGTAKKSGEGTEKVARQVLDEIPALTEAKGFVQGIENAKFDFEVGRN
ncbi:MAG: hypothetical protein LQ344_006349 [Seirophora lacunosa]|nr:MAG: hypothetical protein LQ344_006349 [Seirophora lacunosa]